MAQFFQDNMILVFFVYGLAFFIMGWSILIRTPEKLNQFTKGLKLLALFGILHGGVEWLDMFKVALGEGFSPFGALAYDFFRMLFLGISFCYLLASGFQLYHPRRMGVAKGVALIWLVLFVGGMAFSYVLHGDAHALAAALVVADILTRYFLATPSALLVAVGLWRSVEFLETHYEKKIVYRAKSVAVFFALYAFFGGIITPQSHMGLAWILNYPNFAQLMGVPVQAFRAFTAVAIMFSLLRTLEIHHYDEINRDAKTGLYNTPMIYKFMEANIKRNDPLVVLFIDVDHFKKINDQFGHLVGDEVLVKIATILQANTRSNDCAGRFGGEEFVVVLAEQGMAEALAVADRLRTEIAATPFSVNQGAKPLMVTVSLGVAEYKKEMTVEQLLSRADKAMYWAKKSGRNRVVSIDDTEGYQDLVSDQLRWNTQWESGHPEIDDQHRHLLEMGNQLIALTMQEMRQEEFLRQFGLVLDEISRHFIFEEAVLEQIGYDELEQHKNGHQRLGQEAEKLRGNFLEGQLKPIDVFSFIVDDVVMKHMLQEDIHFYPCLRRAKKERANGKTRQAPVASALQDTCDQKNDAGRGDAKRQQEKKAILTAVNDLVLELDEDLVFTNVYTTDERHLFLPRTDFLGRSIREIFSPQIAEFFIEAMARAKGSGKRESLTYPSPVANANSWYKADIRYLGINEQIAYIINIFDITEQKNAEDLLKESQDKYQLIAENTPDTIWVYNTQSRRFAFVSPAIEKMLGFTTAEAMAMSMEQFLTPEARDEAGKAMAEAIRQFRGNPENPLTDTRDLMHYRKDGSTVWLEQTTKYRLNMAGEIEIVGISHNIDQRKNRENEIHYLYRHDQLTGLMNRNALSLTSLSTDDEDGSPLLPGVIFLNIDNFSFVNDSLGYEYGDRLLRTIADKIRAWVGADGAIYRYGGDEFVVVTTGKNGEEVLDMAKGLMNVASSQISLNNRVVFVTASIGISMGRQQESIEQVIKNANTALHIAKRQKNRIITYSEEMDKTKTREIILEEDMQQALGKRQFELHYQPIFDVNKGQINQAEALLRWNHPELGRISPLDFIPIAERTRLIIPITDWIIKEVCAKLAEWENIGIHDLTISINLSLLSLENRGRELVQSILEAIGEAGIRPAQIKLEITESILMNDVDEVLEVFHELKKAGVKLALDDFGTGYSSFGYMKDLPLDFMKLDRSLISDLANNGKEQMIVESMITIIHGLDLEVVAEGVETREQFEYLMKYDCDYIQGYLFSRPLHGAEFAAYYLAMKERSDDVYAKQEKRVSASTKFELRPEWLSGHAEIDKQHLEMMQIANGVIRRTLDGKSKQEMLAQVNFLLNHCALHFDYEESLMSEIGYGELEQHRKEHRRLMLKANRMKEAYMNDEIRTSAFFAFVMDDFILGHLIDDDMTFFPELGGGS